MYHTPDKVAFGEIQKANKYCKACPLHVGRQNVVVGQGTLGAKILLVGEAPGSTEDSLGIPFQGQAGRVLDTALRAAGIDRERDCFVTNAVRCRPPENRKPKSTERSACSPWLRLDIEYVNPDVIVTLGESALHALLGTKVKLSEARKGGELSFDGRTVIACLHPASLLHNARLKGAFFADIRKVAKSIGIEDKTVLKYTIMGEHERLVDLYENIVSIDCETTIGFEAEVRLIGWSVSWGEGKGAYFPFDSQRAKESLSMLSRIVEAAQVIVMHNSKFDWWVLNAWLTAWGFYPIPFEKVQDTMLMAYVLRKSSMALKNLAEMELGLDVIRLEDLTSDGPETLPTEVLGNYCAQDADLTRRLYFKFLQELTSTEGLWNVYANIDLPLVPVLVDMQRRGVRVDVEYLTELGSYLDEVKSGLQTQIELVNSGPINVNSHGQLAKLLFEKLGLAVSDRTKDGQPSTDKEVLMRLEAEHPVVRLVREWREVDKLKSTFVGKLPKMVNPQTGRVHTTYRQTVTETGRLSSEEPNLQNIPVRTKLGARIRKAFVPTPGWLWMKADQAQVELRIIAVFAQEETLLEAFRTGADPHQATADRMEKSRKDAKNMNYGMTYGETEVGLAAKANVTVAEARALLKHYFDTFPGIKGYIDATKKYVLENGFVRTYFGRRSYKPEVHSGSRSAVNAALRESVNMPIQGTSADIMKQIMARMYAMMNEMGLRSHMLMQVHDELDFEVPPEEVDVMKELFRKVATSVVKWEIPLDVDVKIGTTWGDAE